MRLAGNVFHLRAAQQHLEGDLGTDVEPVGAGAEGHHVRTVKGSKTISAVGDGLPK